MGLEALYYLDLFRTYTVVLWDMLADRPGAVTDLEFAPTCQLSYNPISIPETCTGIKTVDLSCTPLAGIYSGPTPTTYIAY